MGLTTITGPCCSSDARIPECIVSWPREQCVRGGSSDQHRRFLQYRSHAHMQLPHASRRALPDHAPLSYAETARTRCRHHYYCRDDGCVLRGLLALSDAADPAVVLTEVSPPQQQAAL